MSRFILRVKTGVRFMVRVGPMVRILARNKG
jgi:hypothetical protein